jgi:fatty-acyl-CoA synthase
MNGLSTFGDVLALHARLRPDLVGAADLDRALTYASWYARACRLANALLGLGLSRGDRVCVLAYNRIEWLEIYAGAALSGLIAVPVNFRLKAAEVAYIAQDCGARAFLAEAALAGIVEDAQAELPVPRSNFVAIGTAPPGWRDYEALIASARDGRPDVTVTASDPLAFMYTSGTTGRPKGAIRSHASVAMLSLVTALEMSLGPRDRAMLVMPMCHANSSSSWEHSPGSAHRSTSIRAPRSTPTRRCPASPGRARPSPRWCRRTTR